MKKDAKLSCVMIVQQLDEKYWEHWEDKQPINEANNGNVLPLLEETVRRLETNDYTVSEAYGIIHDKDERTIWNEEKMENVTENKAKHVHMLIKFDKGDTLNCLAMATSIEPQYLEKAKSGRYGYDNMTAYLVHAKDPEKFQYSPEEVVTVKGEKYESVHGRRMETWVKGRAIKEAKETNQSVDYVVSEIVKGNLSKEQVILTDELYKVYAQHKRKINEAFETAGENKSYQTVADLEAGKFKKTIIFIHGKSGTGKTRISKEIIETLKQFALHIENKIWDFCMTASTNAFDEYNGQDILFLDDIRGYSLSVSDWLKLLDPYSISPISARYHNKLGSAKVIIITSTMKPADFFETAKANYSEDVGQFIRRIDLLIEIDKETENNFFLYEPTPNEDSSSSQNGKATNCLYSYKFEKIGDFDGGEMMVKFIKTMQTNMKWVQQNSSSQSPQSKGDKLSEKSSKL